MKRILSILFLFISVACVAQNKKVNNTGIYNVQDYGAIGDSTTDNSAAFQRAVDAITNISGVVKRGKIYIPSGIYKLGSTIIIPSTVRIEWQGAGSTFDTVISASTTVGSYYGVTSLYINSTTIDMFRDSSFGATYSNMDLQNITTTNPTAGAAINSLNSMFTAHDMSIRHFFYGIQQQYSTNPDIHHITFRDCFQYSLYTQNLSNSDIGDMRVTGCQFASYFVRTLAHIFNIGSGGTKISDCKFNAGGTYFTDGIKFTVTSPGTSTTDLTVSSCSIENYVGTGINIVVTGGGSFGHVTVTGGNISSYRGGNGITLSNTASTLSNICITGLVLTDCATGITATGVDYLTVGASINRCTTQTSFTSCTNVINTTDAVTNAANGVAPKELPIGFSLPSPGTVAVQDDFGRANTGDINGSTPAPTSISTWTNLFSSAFVATGIISNTIYQPSTGTGGVKTQSNLSSYDVSVVLSTATVTAAGDYSLVGNATDGSNYLFLQITDVGALNLYTKIAGAFTAVYTNTGVTVSNGDTLHLRVIGNVAFAIKNSTVLGWGTFNNAALTGTYCGVLLTGNTATRMSHFTVTGLSYSPATWQVFHDGTLSGLGTPSSPYKVGGGINSGQIALVTGTKVITINGLTTSNRALVQLVTPNTASSTIQYKAVCTANTLTITALVAAGTINVADISTVNYFVIN